MHVRPQARLLRGQQAVSAGDQVGEACRRVTVEIAHGTQDSDREGAAFHLGQSDGEAVAAYSVKPAQG